MTIKKHIFIIIICLVAIGLQETYNPNEVDAFTNQIIQRGSTGDDVIELQARLQYIGYYKGKIDGVFGWGTYWALRNFQKDFGLDIDGLAGLKTRQKLVDASKFDGKWVHTQIAQGNDFTYYGGTPLSEQTRSKKSSSGKGSSGGGGKAAPPQQGAQNTANNNNEAKTERTTTAVNVPQGFSQNDIDLMANAVHGEARGEPYEGQVAVAAVILNRVESSSFPNTVAGVIF